MQGVASKPSRTTADMEWLAQHHGWYCIADTMQITWQIFVSLSMFYLWSRRMLKYLSLASLQRKSLGRDPTLAEVGTHNASVSEDRSVSCPPNFSTRVPIRCSCCMFEYVQSIGREACGSSPLSDRLYRTEEQLDINICLGKNHSLTTCHSFSPHGGIVLLGHAFYEEFVWLAC